MAISVVGSFVNSPYYGGETITYPSGTTTNDVIILALMGYTSSNHTATGFTQATTYTAPGNLYITIFYKVVQSESSTVITTSGSPFFVGMVSLRGATTTNPIASSATNYSSTNSVQSGALTSTKTNGRRIYFGLAIGSSTNVVSSTITGSMTTLGNSNMSGYYQYFSVFISPLDSTVGTITSETFSTTSTASTLVGAVDITCGNLLPNAPTNVSVTNTPVPNGTNPNVQFTFSDPDGTVMSQYQFRWRMIDS